jgi:PAS domain S-box-containing protein
MDGRSRALIYVADITARKHTERALFERERLLSSINASLVGSFVFRVEFPPSGTLRASYLSPNIEELTGHPVAAYFADERLFYTLVLPEDLPRLKEETLRSITSGAPLEVEIRLRHARDGGVRWLRFSGRNVELRADGTVVREGSVTDITGPKSAAAELELARHRLELALRASRTCTWDLDAGSARIVLDPAWATLRGFPAQPTDTTSRQLLLTTHPADRANVIEAARRAILGGAEDYRVEHRVLTAAGDWIWILSQGRVIARDRAGRALRLVGTNTDITARIAAETELRAEAEFLSALHATALDLLAHRELPVLLQALVARAGALLAAPLVTLLLREGDGLVLRAAVGEIGGFALGDRVGPTESPALWRAITLGAPVTLDHDDAFSRPPGFAAPPQSRGALYLPIMRGAEALGVIGLVRLDARRPFTPRDIDRGVMLAGQAALVLDNATLYADALRVAESRHAALRESERRMALAVETAGVGLWILNLATGEVWQSDRWRENFGFAADEPITDAVLFARIHPEDRVAFARQRSRLFEQGEIFDIEYRLLLPDGETRWIAARAVADPGPDGRPALVRGVSYDITRRRSAELDVLQHRAELSHLARVNTLGELSGSLAHELNQPLGIILANAQAAQRLLARQPPDLAEIRDILGDIVREDQRAGQVIQRLRLLLKQGETRLRPLALNKVVQDVLHLARSDLIARRVTVRLHLADALPAIEGDEVQLQQVLLNLLLNAGDAMEQNAPADRDLHIVTAVRGAHVRLSLRDVGCGLPPGDPEQVFRPFFTTKAHGLGLGLGICRTIVTAASGRLWAEPNLDRGTTFHVELPATPAA